MAFFNEDTFLYDKNPNSALFHLYAFGKLLPDANYIISRKENPDTIIECVLDGVGYIDCDGYKTTVSAGDCYILKSGKSVTYYSDDVNPYTKIWVTFSGSIIDKWLDLYGVNSTPFVRSLNITPYYNQIKSLALGKENFDREKKLMLLAHNIIFEMGMTAPKAARSSKNESPYIKTSDNVIIDVKKHIEKMCNQPLTTKELSLKFGMSQGKMNKMFTEKYGVTPSKYHMNCKLISAVYFLESTDLGIDTISETIGFCDRSHFRKAFVAKYGVTPCKYRKNYLSKTVRGND